MSFNKFLCKTFGHIWDKSNQYDQNCLRKGCYVHRVLTRSRFEKIGENPYSWMILDIDDILRKLL